MRGEMLVLHRARDEKDEWTTWRGSRDEVRFISDTEDVKNFVE